jgi:hypothetical protein
VCSGGGGAGLTAAGSCAGTIGFIGTDIFVRRIYQYIKSD